MKSDLLTVSEYSSRLGTALRQVGAASLEGEVQKVTVSARSGMVFFDLTDGEASLSCKVFPREVARLERRPISGDLVRVQVDRPDLYPAQGALSLIVSQITLAGEGELLRKRQELIARFTREGLCDPARRRPLPAFPRTVGVIAGAGSDAMSDVIKALTDRWPSTHVVAHASLVQGKAAPRELIIALANFQEHALADVVVMARGGGSVQDLVCFDDESLCRALFACEIPVVCAIGHTDNNPVCNHVTWSAHTPSRSAELVVQSIVEVRQIVGRAGHLLDNVPGKLDVSAERVTAAKTRLELGPALDARGRDVAQASGDVTRALRDFFHTHTTGLGDARALLTATPRRAMLELTGEHTTLAAASTTLARTSDHLSGLAAQTAELGARIGSGIHWQLADHAHNHLRAFARLMTEAAAGFVRQDGRHRELIRREGELLATRARARLDHGAREVGHLAELVAARDFRRRGWLLGTRAGRPVRSIVDLQGGDRIELHVHDGSAEAVIDQIHPSRSTKA